MPVLLQNKRMKNRHIVIDTKVPTGRSQPCDRCGKNHSTKTLHVRSDSEGRVTVSMGVFEAWETAGLGAWKYVDIVDEPLERGAISHG